MQYVIMANGKGRRWGGHDGVPKHLIEIDGESLLDRTIRLIAEIDPLGRIVISSSQVEYDKFGVDRYAPPSNAFEIERFPIALSRVPTCFLYGDVFYTHDALRCVVQASGSDFLFFGNEHSIIAVKAFNAFLFSEKLEKLTEKIRQGEESDGKGWQLYHWLLGMPMPGHAIADHFVRIEDETRDFNTPDELRSFLRCRERRKQ
ncbi:MAG TPA: NTP transferase domain-containing protein [Candidatus Rubneribacter avistercoris]|nr:NTP transferase domain-containing protein [Candidatus Rubneribacter avistercoris]